MKLDNSFTVPVPEDEAWMTLLDVERIIPAVPGAEITEFVDDRTYKGKVSVRLGPVALSFRGKAAFVEIDDANHRARLKANGADAKGRGGANADVIFTLTPSPEGTLVTIGTDLQLTGSVAQYGRASGVIEDVAAQIVEEFAANLREMLGPRAAVASGAEAAPEAAPSAKPIGAGGLALRVFLRRLSRLWARLRSS